MLKIAFDQVYQHVLPASHRFPMIKYELIPKQLINEGIISSENLFKPNVCEDSTLLLTHDSNYLEQLNNCELEESHIRKIGFPLSKALILREKIIMQGTIDCAMFALKFGVSLNIAGGTHHAFRNKGEGFCLLNDLAVASNYLLHQKLANKILIVDLDVHQGNGTASIFIDNPHVFTFSMHGKNNYPFHKEKSDLDIELQDGIVDNDYLKLLETHLNEIVLSFKPDFIFYQSGVDILQTDKFGKLNITLNGCLMRDQIVFAICKQQNIPIVAAMGGGYSPNIQDIVEAHCNTFKIAAKTFFS